MLKFQEKSKKNAEKLVLALLNQNIEAINCFSRDYKSEDKCCEENTSSEYFISKLFTTWYIDLPNYFSMCSAHNEVKGTEYCSKEMYCEETGEWFDHDLYIKRSDPADWCFYPDIEKALKSYDVAFKVQDGTIILDLSSEESLFETLTEGDLIQNEFDLAA
jgi:hypothetical protein